MICILSQGTFATVMDTLLGVNSGQLCGAANVCKFSSYCGKWRFDGKGAMSLPRISLSHSISFHIFNTDLYGSGADFDILETTFPVTVQFFDILGLQIR